MSVYIVDDEQRRDRPASPMRPSGSGGAGASAVLALLDDARRHRLRRADRHLPLGARNAAPPDSRTGSLVYDSINTVTYFLGRG